MLPAMSNSDLSLLATAVQPQQERGRRRFESVLEEAEALLQDNGLEGFSIPSLAERLDFTRRSIYKFFPTPYAILNELVQRYLQELMVLLIKDADRLSRLSLDDTVAHIARLGADFYNSRPTARLLILGGPVTDKSYRAQTLVVETMGGWARRYLEQRGITLPKPPPDIATLTVEFCLTCYRLSYHQHGEITPEYRDEAAYAMKAYLSRYLS